MQLKSVEIADSKTSFKAKWIIKLGYKCGLESFKTK